MRFKSTRIVFFSFSRNYLSYLIKNTADSWANDQAQAEKCLQAGESGGDVIGEFFGDNGETCGEERRVPHSLHDSNHERKDYERIMAVHFVQQTEEDGAGPCCQDTAVEQQLRPDSVQLQCATTIRFYCQNVNESAL